MHRKLSSLEILIGSFEPVYCILPWGYRHRQRYLQQHFTNGSAFNAAMCRNADALLRDSLYPYDVLNSLQHIAGIGTFENDYKYFMWTKIDQTYALEKPFEHSIGDYFPFLHDWTCRMTEIFWFIVPIEHKSKAERTDRCAFERNHYSINRNKTAQITQLTLCLLMWYS